MLKFLVKQSCDGFPLTKCALLFYAVPPQCSCLKSQKNRPYRWQFWKGAGVAIMESEGSSFFTHCASACSISYKTYKGSLSWNIYICFMNTATTFDLAAQSKTSVVSHFTKEIISVFCEFKELFSCYIQMISLRNTRLQTDKSFRKQCKELTRQQRSFDF